MNGDDAAQDGAVATLTEAPWLDMEKQFTQQLLDRREEIFPTIESLTRELEAIEARLYAINPSALGEGDGGRERRPYRRTATSRVQRGQHDEQFLNIVSKYPNKGITVAEIAREAYGEPTQGQTTYLYKVGARLEEAGAVVKRGTSYYPEQAGAEDHAERSGDAGQSDSERSEPARS